LKLFCDFEEILDDILGEPSVDLRMGIFFLGTMFLVLLVYNLLVVLEFLRERCM